MQCIGNMSLIVSSYLKCTLQNYQKIYKKCFLVNDSIHNLLCRIFVIKILQNDKNVLRFSSRFFNPLKKCFPCTACTLSLADLNHFVHSSSLHMIFCYSKVHFFMAQKMLPEPRGCNIKSLNFIRNDCSRKLKSSSTLYYAIRRHMTCMYSTVFVRITYYQVLDNLLMIYTICCTEETIRQYFLGTSSGQYVMNRVGVNSNLSIPIQFQFILNFNF